jgi:S-adenosyl methyltransferase
MEPPHHTRRRLPARGLVLVTDEWLKHTTRPVRLTRIDPSVPNVARVWNYLVGGRDNFEADRNAARQLIEVAPVMRAVGPASRVFLRRVIGYLAGAGIRQFLDIGTGIPTAGNTHEIAQSVAPESRIVLVDNDPVVLAHARALLRSSPEGVTSYVDADVREPGKIMAAAGESLDFDEPVALVLIGTLCYVEGTDEVTAIVRTLLDAVPPGSYLAVTQPASDLDETANEAQRWWNENVPTAIWLRDRAAVTDWFDGLELVEPGLVRVDKWRPARGEQGYAGVLPLYGAVGRKP